MDTATATGTEPLRLAHRLLGAAVAILLAGATGSALAESWRLVPSVRLDLTGTDNVTLAPSDAKQGDVYLEVAPAISIRGESARLKGNLSYQLRGFVYARDSGRSDFQNSLQAAGTLEAIENWFFVDVNASIAQQAVSAFGPRPTDSGTTNSNQTESRALQISPYVKGQLGTAADYQVRYTYAPFSTTTAAVSSSWSETWKAQVSGKTVMAQLGWGIDVDDERIHYQRSPDSRMSRVRGVLEWPFGPQFLVFGIGGFERNNFLTVDAETYNNYGAGFEWAPTERTKVKATRERRFFGDGWNYEATHRMPNSSFSYRESRDVSTNLASLFGSASASAYDLLFNALASRFPDPVERAAEARRLLEQGTIPADLGITNGFVSSSAYLERRREATMVLMGVRNSLSLSLYQARRQPLGAATTADEVARVSETNEHGASINVNHRLSGISSINAATSWRRSTGDQAGTGSRLATSQWDFKIDFVTQIGARTSGHIGFRHVDFNGSEPSASYRENAVTAGVSMIF